MTDAERQTLESIRSRIQQWNAHEVDEDSYYTLGIDRAATDAAILLDFLEQLLVQVAWMEHERERIIEWLSDRAGTAADADDALFLFGLTRGFTPDGHPWAGPCTCGAKTFDDCVCNGGEV